MSSAGALRIFTLATALLLGLCLAAPNGARAGTRDANSTDQASADQAAAYPAKAAPAPGANGAGDAPWRIRFLEAAIVRGPKVLLGEVAVPLGDIAHDKWGALAARELWPSPPEGGKAVNMTRPRIQEAVMSTMEDLAPYCLFPGSMALQRGGELVGKESIRQLVERELAPYLGTLPGEGLLKDFRLPQHVFLSDDSQTLALEPIRKMEAGRLSIRLVVREMDGTVRQKLSGTVFVDCWVDAPCAVKAMARDDLLEHNKITFKRVNLAALRGIPWDGRGGPWRLVRPVNLEQVIYQSDIAHIPTVRKGGKLNLLYEGRTVRLSVHAEAMADGAAGETILVRNLQSRKEIYAIVRDSSTALVSAAQ